MSTQKISFVQIEIEQLREIIKDAVKEEYNRLLPCINSQEDKLLSRKQAAQKLGVSLPTLWKITKSGALPALKLGGRILYKNSELMACLKPIQTIKYKRQY